MLRGVPRDAVELVPGESIELGHQPILTDAYDAIAINQYGGEGAIPTYSLIDVIEGKENLATYKTWAASYEFQRPFSFPPETPPDRLQILRKAYMDTMKDPEFLADAKKAKLDLNPDDGAGLERNVKEIFDLEPSLAAKLKEILK